ncbi:MAG: hypothetical protein U5Q16_09065 [Gammaproteobacteria bacterium]|nr:hypothetical protein [Gammaproteobacteria bacterium]
MQPYDRSQEDVGNVLALEHVNLTVPDQSLAALFYVTGLGFTRDPYIDFGTRNMWINVGEQQFHLPLGEAQVFRGHITVVVPDLDDLEARLVRIAKPLGGTRFAVQRHADHMRTTCPWGNDIRAYGPDHQPPMTLGIPRLELPVAAGSAAGIARFYRDTMGCPVSVEDGQALVRVGRDQTLAFTETTQPLAPYDGHHIAVYLANFSGPHRYLAEHGLISEESDRYQYRFQTIIDPDSGQALLELEHEVRAMSHPMFQRPLVNRDPAVGFRNYRKGKEVFKPA